MERNKIRLGLSFCVLTAGIGLGAAAGCSSPGEESEPTATVQQALLPCDPAAPFNPPTAAFTGTTLIDGITFSQDGLKAYLSGKIGAANSDIFVTTRPNLEGAFGALTKLEGGISTASSERSLSLSPDGARLYFGKYVNAGTRFNLYYAALDGNGAPTAVTSMGSSFNGSLHDQDPFFHAGTNKLYFAKEPEDGQRDLYVSTFTAPDSYSTPTAIHTSAYDEYRPVLSPDGLTLYFSSTLEGIGGDNGGDIWVVKRTNVNDSFSFSAGQVTNLYTLNTSRIEFPAGISNDGCTLYFASNRDTTSLYDYRLYQATRGTSVPSSITTTIQVVGTGSIITAPYQCSTTCSFDAPPDSVIYVEASDQALWSGSCSPYGGGQSSDGAFVFTNGGTCTVTFPDGITGDAGSGCISSNWCDTGLECTLNVCRCPPGDPNCVCIPTCSNNSCGAYDGCGDYCPCEPGEPCGDDSDCAAGAKCCGEVCGGEGCECGAGNQCAAGLECEGGECVTGPPPHCSNNVEDADETDTDCGGGECAGCGSGDTCTLDSDCTAQLQCVYGVCTSATACSSDLDCPPLFSCAHDVGAQFGLPTDADVCWPLHCNEIDPSQPGCGVNDDPLCGTCPACTPDCSGRSCGSNGCAGSCGSCASGEACTPEGHCVEGMLPGGFYATSGHSSGFPLPLPEQPTAEVGAVQGSFSVSSRGAANYSIPIRLPPARAGFAPDLSLTYTGGKHEGLMGQGWRVAGFSAVARCPREGRPTSYSLPDFCLDGAHLIELDDQGSSPDREYRTEVDNFSRIIGRGVTIVPGENNTTTMVGPDYFEVTTKDGRRLTYGKSGNSSLFSHNVKRVWALEEARDRAGNSILFEYHRHTVKHGIVKGLEVVNTRVDTGELLPRTITYNGHEPERVGDLWVEFAYESRPDPQYHFVDGARGFSIKRLKRVTTVVAGTPVRTYSIGYKSGNQTAVESISECTDEGGQDDECVPATIFAYEPFVPYAPVGASWLDLGAGATDATVAMLDQDGDGYSDVLVRQQSGSSTSFKVVRSRVQADGSIVGDAIALPWQSAFAPNLIADVNRDGRDDIIDPGGRVFISGTSGFTQATFVRPSGTIGAAQTLDFDGDGQRDYATVQAGSGVAFFRTNGDGISDGVLFSPPDVPNNCLRLLPIDVDGDRAEEALCIPLGSGALFAVGASRSVEGLLPKQIATGIITEATSPADIAALDFNGDGLRDVLERRASGDEYVLWENSGDGFLPRVLDTVIAGGEGPFMTQGPSTAAVLDFNGDGRDDLLLSIGGTTFLYSPTGRQQLTRTDPGLGKMGSDAEPVLAGDLNGDGNVDLVGKGLASLQDAAFGAASVAGLLTGVTTGLGSHIQIKYAARTLVDGELARTHAPACSVLADQEVACIGQLPPLVSEYVEEDLPASRRGRRSVLSYSGAKKGLRGRGFYGFSSQQVTLVSDEDQVAGSTTLRFYNEDQTRAGMVSEKIIRSATISATVASREYFAETSTSFFVDIGYSAAGRPFPKMTGGLTVFNEVFPGIALEELGRRAWANDITEFGDAESVVTQDTVGVVVEETTRTVDEWDDDIDSWRIGFPKDVTVVNSRGGETLTRRVHYDYYDNGLLENVIRDAGTGAADPNIYLKVNYVRQQPYWNVERVVSSPLNLSVDRPVREEVITYDDRSTLPLATTNPEGHTTEIDLDPETGQLRVLRDPNGIFERRAYDGLGRVKVVAGADRSVDFTYQNAVPFQSSVVGAVVPTMEVIKTPTGGAQMTTRTDAFGRVVSVETVGFEGTLVNQEFVYDWNHRLVTEALPHIAGNSSQGTTTRAYDEAGRLRSVTTADGAVTEHFYASKNTFLADFAPWFGLQGLPAEAARMVAVVKPGTNVEARMLDHVGKPVASFEAEGLEAASMAAAHYATMAFGAFGGLRETKDQVGNVTSMLPDAWGRITDVDAPDSASVHYDLSPWGEIESVTDGIGTRLFRRDKLGRLRKITRTNDEVIASWTYDGPASRNEVGRLISTYRESQPESGVGSTTTYVYEQAVAGLGNTGRRSRIERILNDAQGNPRTFVTGFAYDEFGRIETIAYPSAPSTTPGGGSVPFEVFHDYDDASGALSTVREVGDPQDPAVETFWTMLEADQGFRLARERFGNGVESERQYYSLDDALPECVTSTGLSCRPGMLRSITTSRNQPGDVQELTYQYDDNLNLKHRNSGGGALSETFMYDGFDQLEEHSRTTNGGTPVVDTFTYDAVGNIDTRSGITYDYSGTGLPHAVGSIGDTVYQYDANGSQWKREGSLVPGGYQELLYNDFQMPWRITTGQGMTASSIDFEYDAFERRIAKRSSSETTLYVGDLYEHVTRAAEEEHRYKIFAGESLVAQVTKTQVGAVVTQVDRTYVHGDHLGSSAGLTTSSGTETREYEAFGATPTNFSSTSVRSGFTGHEHDGELGLINMRGRLYDPAVGQFLQEDPFVSTLNPRGLNRYAYVMNNPLMNTDPSGFFLNPISFIGSYIGLGRRDNDVTQDEDEPGSEDLSPIFNLDDGDLPVDLTGLPPQEGGVSAEAPGAGAGPAPGTFPTPGTNGGGGSAPDPGMGASLGSEDDGGWSQRLPNWGGGNLIAGGFAATACVAFPQACAAAGGAAGLGPWLLPAVGAAATAGAIILIWKAIEAPDAREADVTPGKGDEAGAPLTEEEAVEAAKNDADVLAKSKDMAQRIAEQAGKGKPFHDNPHKEGEKPHFHRRLPNGERGKGHIMY